MAWKGTLSPEIYNPTHILTHHGKTSEHQRQKETTGKEKKITLHRNYDETDSSVLMNGNRDQRTIE